MAKIAPSILAADFAKLGSEIADICKGGCDYIHIDIMDGAFVPNISFGSAVMKSLNNYASVPYDVHLMILNPDQYLEELLFIMRHVLTYVGQYHTLKNKG